MEHKFRHDKNTAVVETTRGMIQGYEYDGISIFKGVPYAVAERFHSPRPVEAWDGIFDATSYGYVCPLLDNPKLGGELKVPHRYWVMDENCQNLNIWTPACDGAKRPVVVWLHGGAYRTGSSIEHVAYEGENMCRRGQVVVVSINHRLNVLGYCDLSTFGEEYKNSGNAGTDDIIAALKWIRENISYFGGDAANVTLMGQSGGGSKITTLLQTPAADGLYAKGIIMSGILEESSLTDSVGSGERLVRAMLEELALKEVKDLEAVPYEMLAAAYKKVKPERKKGGAYVGSTPHPNEFYMGNALENGFRPETADIPLLIGTVFGEFSGFVESPCDKKSMTREKEVEILRTAIGTEETDRLVPLFEKAYPMRHVSDILLLDFLFRTSTKKYIGKRSELNQCTYAYLFNLDLPIDGGSVPWHCSDIPFVFHNTEFVPAAQETGVTERLESQIFECVMAFAKTGNPNHPGIPKWPSCTPTEEMTMIFDTNTKVCCNHDKELMPVMETYLKARMETITRSMFR